MFAVEEYQQIARDFRGTPASYAILGLLTEIKKMQSTLAPFAEAARSTIDETDKDDWEAWGHACGMAVTVGDFRRAQAALGVNGKEL